MLYELTSMNTVQPSTTTAVVLLPGLGSTGLNVPPEAFLGVRARVLSVSYGTEHVDTMAAMADITWQLLDAIDIHDVILVGYSMGGMVLQAVYEAAPYRVRGAVFLCTGVPKASDLRIAMTLAPVRSLVKTGTLPRSFSRQKLAGFMFSPQDLDALADDLTAARRAVAFGAPAASPAVTARQVGAIIAAARANRKGHPPEMRCHVLVVSAKKDRVIPYTVTRRLRRLESSAASFKEVRVPDAGHGLFLSHPDTVAHELRTWLCAIADGAGTTPMAHVHDSWRQAQPGAPPRRAQPHRLQIGGRRSRSSRSRA